MFHNTSPDGFESLFVKAEDSETKEDLRVEETTAGSLGGAPLVLGL